MNPSACRVLLTGGLLILGTAFPRVVWADTMNVDFRKSDQRGSLVHAVPLTNRNVRMAAERVVIVPYWDAKRRGPRVLTHVWYDFVNEGPRARLQLGFPEMRALFRYQLGWAMSAAPRRVGQSWDLPTISSFGARVGARSVTVRAYPGVGRYRRWFTFGMDFSSGNAVRVHTTYLSTLGRWIESFYHGYGEYNSAQATVRYFLHYILHTGAGWRGPIGKGEVLLHHRGRLQTVRRFANLEPSVKDDLGLELDLSRHKQWDCGSASHYHLHSQLDRLRLVQSSGQLASERVDTHAALVADGDPKTQWVSLKGRAVRSFVQLPSDPDRVLKSVRITSGKTGPGRVRPARVALRCKTQRFTTLLARADLPDGAGPHVIAVPKPKSNSKPKRCGAVRVEVESVHGDPKGSVVLAEVGQAFTSAAGAKSTAISHWRWGIMNPYRDPLSRTDRINSGATRSSRLGSSTTPAFAVVDIDRVQWSADGTLLHYWLQRENVTKPAAGVRLGYFVDVATGKVIRTYRLDRVGVLPASIRREWEQGLPFHQGIALLKKHGFQPAKAGRSAPRRSALRGQKVRLRGTVKGRAGGYWITRTRRGFKWSFGTYSARHKGAADTQLKLQYSAKGQPERLLTSRSPKMDLAFATRHAAAWKRRGAIFTKAVTAFTEHQDVDDEKLPDPAGARVRWQVLTYPHRQAYGGDVRLFWQPAGEALAAFGIERQDFSSLHKDPEPRDVIPQCAWLPRMVCPWDRRDETYRRVALSVHAFVPRQPTTLLEPYSPPAPIPAVATPKNAPRPVMTTPAMAMAKSGPKAKANGRGCGCRGATGTRPGGGALAFLSLLLVWVWRREMGT